MKGPVRNPSTYAFNAAAKTVTFLSPVPGHQGEILGIINNTRNVLIYTGAKAGCGGGWASPVLTLTFDTTAHSNSDSLTVICDDGATSQAINDGGNSITVDGTVAISNSSIEISNDSGNPVPVSGTFWQATQPVSGPLTDSQLRATALPVSGTLTANAGANLDTSELALESGGNLAGIRTDLGTDGTSPPTLPGSSTGVRGWLRWLGQSAFQLGAGALTSTVQRVTLATDGQAASAIGSSADSQASDDTSPWSLVALMKRLSGKLALGAQPVTAGIAVTPTNKIAITGPSGQSVVNTNLVDGVVSGWTDVSAYDFVDVTIISSAGVSAGTLLFELSGDSTLDPSGYSAPYYTSSGVNSPLSVAGFVIGASTVYQRSLHLPARFFRLRINAVINGGTVQAVFTFSNRPSSRFSVAQKIDLANLSGVNFAVPNTINGATTAVLPAVLVGPNVLTDYIAANLAAASGSAAINAIVSSGLMVGFLLSLTAWTAGSSIGLDVFLQASLDGGTTWIDVWQCEAFTATGTVIIPPTFIPGRRRIRWVNRGGAATTATLAVTSNSFSGAFRLIRQFYDRTSGVGSGTAVLFAVSTSYYIAGLNVITVAINAGTATAVGSFQVQMSIDGVSWYAASEATPIASTAANVTLIPITINVIGKFLRLFCTAAGTSQVINAIHIYGSS